MTFEKKRLSKDAVEAALQKAERYRLLNEPSEAESICQDVLEADPGNAEALVILVLALTDQFGTEMGDALTAAKALLSQLSDPYQRAYYGGIVCERWAKALFQRNAPGSDTAVHDWLHDAMKRYEEAERLRRPGDDDALLRWNACARMLERHSELRPASEGPSEPIQSE